eukprot:g32792.t1
MADSIISVVPAERWSGLPHEVRILCLKESLLLHPSPAASLVVPWNTEWSNVSTSIGDLDVAVAIAAWRWFDTMKELLLAPKASAFLQELCARTRQGQQVPVPEALADMRPQLGELIRLDLDKPTADSSVTRSLRHFAAQRGAQLRETLRELRGGHEPHRRSAMGLSHASSQHLLQRLETLRSARRSAVEFLDAPLIAGVRPEETTGADAYAVSWPLDLAAGVLDIMATLSNLALRATAFATAYPECLHWKYRPKPIHLHLHAASIDRLAQSLLCFLIMKQLGEKADETGKRHRRWGKREGKRFFSADAEKRGDLGIGRCGGCLAASAPPALTVAVLFFLYLGPGQRQGEGVAAEKMREVLSDVPQLVLAVGPGETVPCHREPAFFFVPFSFGILASLVANWILWTAGCWHFWITGLFLQLGCIYGFVTALDECILSLRQGLVEAGSSVYLICPLGYLKAPGLDPFIMKHFLFLTGKIASLVLRVSIQLLIALWVEAMTLYRLKCMKAVSGRKRSALCLQVTFLWWMQVMLLPVAMLPVRSITPFARKLIFFAFLASYLLGAVQIIRLLLTIIARLREYYATAERHRDTEEALECLQRGRERVWINCIGYFVHVILGIAIGTIVVISNEQAFNTRDEVDSEDFPTLLRISFILPAFHIFILIGGPWVLGNANATVAQQSQFCVWRRKRTRTQRLEPSWLEKVRDLSQRGITSGCAYAVHIADGKPVPVRNMVTHTWENLFRDLVAAVVADALDENTFDVIAHILQEDPSLLEQMLGEVNQLHATYWICAFAVNQHTSICNINPGRNVDSLTKQPYPLCDCRTPKFLNNTPPLDGKGRSIQCELNKFDHMMAIIAADNRHFAEVLAIDQDFGLFNRAWCVAELAEARLLRMPQHVKIPSKSALARHMDGLRHLRVQELRATRPEDVQEILSKIPDFESFNQALHELIFDPQLGILANWRDLDAARQMEEVGLAWVVLKGGVTGGEG